MPNPTHFSSFDLEIAGKELNKILDQIIYQKNNLSRAKKKKTFWKKFMTTLFTMSKREKMLKNWKI